MSIGEREWLEKQVKVGDQIFVVCPLIETSDHEAMSEVKAAEMEFSRLKNDIFPNLRLGLVHGKLKSKDKDKVINDFAAKKYDLLVATPVIEVGIDIPNATVMVIEGAERFGLAQLHQLRGRVGRGNKQSYCLLFPTDDSKNPTRLKYMETTQSGFQLAELDLKLRGPGDMYGTKQSGFIDLKIATLEDEHLIRASHQYAATIIDKDPELRHYPAILSRLNRLIKKISEPN